MKLKKVLAVTLTVSTLVGCLAGCGTKQDEPGKNETAGSVEFWNDKFLNNEQADVDKIFSNISELSGIEVEPITYPDTAAYQTAMQQSIKGEDAPGLFTWWSGPQLETLASNDYIEDLTDMWDEYVEANGVAADIADSLTIDGKICAVPYSIIYNAIIFNKDVFAKYNLEVPTTYDEFVNVCKTLKDNGVTPIGLKNDSWAGFIWFQAMLASYDPQLYQDVCDGTKSYVDEDVVTVMNKWKELLDNGYFSAPMSIQDLEKTVATGGAAMMLDANYETGILEKDFGAICGENIGTFALPSMNGDKKVIFFEVTPLCVSKASKDKDAAKEVLKSWFSKENQTVLTEVTNNVNTSEVEVDNACVNEMISYSKDSENYTMMLRYYENTPEEIRDVALDQLMKFQLGNAGVDEVLSTIQTTADEVFAK